MIISRFPQQAAPQIGFNYTGNFEVVDDAGGYKIRLLSSGVFTPGADMLVDLFAVGGGSGGFAGKYQTGGNSESEYTYQDYYYGGGGSGGYTDTVKNVTLEAGEEYAVTIGAGGAGGTGQAEPGAGGETSLGEIISANGGYAARYKSRYSSGDVWRVLTNPSRNGCTGGCGGGVGNQYEYKRYKSGKTGFSSWYGGAGGSDGSDGKGSMSFAGEGQLTTTREFGEATGALYAGGGAGGWHWEAIQAIDYQGGEGGGGNGCHWNGRSNYIAAENGAANTGGGGGGGDKDHAGGSGGSGILIIRNARGE